MNVTDLKRFLDERSENVPAVGDLKAGALKRARGIRARRLSVASGLVIAAIVAYGLKSPAAVPVLAPTPSSTSSPLMHGFPERLDGAERIGLYHFNFADKPITFTVPATAKGFWLIVGCVPYDSSEYLHFNFTVGQTTTGLGMSCLATGKRFDLQGMPVSPGNPAQVTVATGGAQKIGIGRTDYSVPPREIPFPSGTLTIAVMAVL